MDKAIIDYYRIDGAGGPLGLMIVPDNIQIPFGDWTYKGEPKSRTRAEAELLAVKIKELLTKEERVRGWIGPVNVGLEFMDAIDNIRAAEKRLEKPKDYRVIIKTGSCIGSLLMTLEQLEANKREIDAALEKAKGELG
ncbi:MAG: hypothetical protein PHG61_09855 [Candidatus Marinimicrobia bacterium]|nr:hypothetical protein [Candidatus Neomarinimicrobiota bacterium]